MNAKYLSRTGDSLCFQTESEFQSIIATLQLTVPARNEGRKSFHRERTCLVMYLKELVAHSRIDFPFCVRKTESPDFLLTVNDEIQIGIEHRDITSQRFQQHLSESANGPSGQIVWLDRFKATGEPTSELNTGWVGDEVEREWAQLALDAIRDKTHLLNKGHFQNLPSYELLLYSNTHLPNIDRRSAIDYLRTSLNREFADHTLGKRFDSISIIYGDQVWLRELTVNAA
jgi:hypothetical protein